MNDETPHGYLEAHVAEILRADPWFAENRVEIIEQNSQALGEQLKKSGAEVDGISLIISYDKQRKFRSNPPQLEVNFSLLLTEYPATNRQQNTWTSALDAAHRAREDLEDADPSLVYEDTVHSTPGYGMLVAVAKFHTMLTESD